MYLFIPVTTYHTESDYSTCNNTKPEINKHVQIYKDVLIRAQSKKY